MKYFLKSCQNLVKQIAKKSSVLFSAHSERVTMVHCNDLSCVELCDCLQENVISTSETHQAIVM